MQYSYTDDVLEKRTLEIYIILLTHVTPINLIKIFKISVRKKELFSRFKIKLSTHVIFPTEGGRIRAS